MMKKNRLMRKWFCIYTRQSAVISTIAVIICVFAVAIEFPRGNSFDYLGLIIGILALMITFVVAWQIWQTIASREDIQEARDAVKHIDAIEKKVDGIVPLTDSHFQYALATAMRMKGLDIAEVRSENFDDKERAKMSQRAFYTCSAFSQYLSALQQYSKTELDVKRYIAECISSIENMAMRMRGNYDLVTKGLINIMIADLESVLIKSGNALSAKQISTLKDLQQELTRNLPNGIDAEEALAEKRKQREAKHGNNTPD